MRRVVQSVFSLDFSEGLFTVNSFLISDVPPPSIHTQMHANASEKASLSFVFCLFAEYFIDYLNLYAKALLHLLLKLILVSTFRGLPPLPVQGSHGI